MSLIDTIRKDMFQARKAGEINKSNILSMAISSINNLRLETQKDLTDEEVVSVLRKEEKKLKEAYEQYTQNGREDLAKVEKEQLETVQQYLPQLMSEEEVEGVVKAEIAKMGEVTAKDIGRVMGSVMGQLKGRADGQVVSATVKKLLNA